MHQKRPPRIAQVEPSEQDGRAGSGGRNDDGRWLSIHDACALLGVDQSTLRRWSDAGKVPVFRTPGGHRRYAEADLVALVGDGPARRERPRVSQQTLTDRSLSAYEDEYLGWCASGAGSAPMAPPLRRSTAASGGGWSTSRSATRRWRPAAGDRASLLDEGRQIGGHYGRAGAGHGLTPAEMVEAFLYFRYPVVRAVTGMIEEQELAARRAIRVFAEISHFMDQILVATVAAHESETSRRGDEQTGAFDAGPSSSPRLLVSSSPLPEGP
jgi:excisionase family DNA binding protein